MSGECKCNLCDMIKQTTWINVEDRLPPQNVYVLICHWDYRPKVNMKFVSIAERMGPNWYAGENGEEVTKNGKYGKITHWMSLPEPPED